MSESGGVAWLFDVDGTVLDLVTGNSLRPLTKELFFALRARGVPVLLWSAGGADYARRRARLHGIAGLVSATYTKTERDEHGRWLLPDLPPGHRPAVLVDDEPREIRYTGEIVGVPPYVGDNPRDTAFVPLLRRLAAEPRAGKGGMVSETRTPGKDRPLARRIRQVPGLDPSATALVFEGREYPWDYLRTAGTDLDDLLAAAGMAGATRIGIVLRNRPAQYAAIAATLGSGRQIITLSPFHSDFGLAEDIRTLAPDVVIADAEDWTRPGVEEAAAAAGALALETGADRALVPRAMDWRVRPAPAEPSDVAVLMLTSGTTGAPKRVELSYERLAAALAAGGTKAGPDDEVRLRPGTGILWASLVHIGGLYFVVANVLAGRATVLMERFEVDRWAEVVARHRPRLVGLPPAALRMVLDADVPGEVFAASEAVLSGTAPLDPADADRFEQRYGIPVLTTYGATEFAGAIAGWTLSARREWGSAKRGSAGLAHPGVELRVIGQESGKPLPPGEIGVLEARGPQLPVPPGDWIRTTDLASLDEDGFLYLHGRVDDAINRGGFTIVPAAIEEAARAHPAVADAAAVGIPDPRLGEVPVLAVTVRAKAARPEIGELRSWLAERLVRYHLPVEIKIVGELPRTPSLKVSRPRLRALFGAEPGSA